MMRSDRAERHVTPADGNIFEDLGFPAGEAKTLIIRSTLMVAAKQCIEERISDLMRGRIDQFTIDSLINMLTTAGVPVEVRAAGNAA
jgi:predicted XRE-type DNA-binding protein